MWNMITHFLTFTGGMSASVVLMLIIPGFFEPLVRTLRATIPKNESHLFR